MHKYILTKLKNSTHAIIIPYISISKHPTEISLDDRHKFNEIFITSHAQILYDQK